MSNYKYTKKWRMTPNGREKRRILRQRYYEKYNFGTGELNRYSDEDLELINDPKLTDREIAKILGRSVMAIQIKRSRMRKEGKNARN